MQICINYYKIVVSTFVQFHLVRKITKCLKTKDSEPVMDQNISKALFQKFFKNTFISN